MPQTGSSVGAMDRVSFMCTSCRVLTNLSGALPIVSSNVPPNQFCGRSNGDTMNDELTITPERVATAAPPPAGRAALARIGLLGIGAAALIAAAMLIFGAGASPGGMLAAGTDGTSSASGEALPGFRGGPHGPGG